MTATTLMIGSIGETPGDSFLFVVIAAVKKIQFVFKFKMYFFKLQRSVTTRPG